MSFKCTATLLMVFTCFITLGQELTVFRSKLSVTQTTEKLIKTIKSKDLVFSSKISYKEKVKEYGVELRETNIVLFEDSKLTAQILDCEPTVALDMPLKVIIWEEDEEVFIGYMDPKLYRRRYFVTECDDILHQLTSILVRVVNETLRER